MAFLLRSVAAAVWAKNRPNTISATAVSAIRICNASRARADPGVSSFDENIDRPSSTTVVRLPLRECTLGGRYRRHGVLRLGGVCAAHSFGLYYLYSWCF